jgi:hypothetical protein
MLDAIATVDNLGMEDSATDVSQTIPEPTATLDESQGSSLQETDFKQALMEMMSSLGADEDNPSLEIVSGQSVEDALADVIPGLDPTTVTPPAPLADDSTDDSGLDEPDSLGEAFQALSDGFEGLSNSFEQLAASFLLQDGNFDTVAIGTEGDDTNADLTVTSLASDEAADDAPETDVATLDGDDLDASVDDGAIGVSDDEMNADFGISKMLDGEDSNALDIDFDALKVNVDQISRGLQFLVQQLEAAFEEGDLTATTPLPPDA